MYIQRNSSFVRIAFVLLLILATTGKAATLPPLRYQSFSNLKSETQTLVVKAIVQDSSGMMWFVDKKALSAWDGYNLHRYTHPKQSDMGSPRCALVAGGSILVGHEHGLLQFNLNTRSFQRDSLYDDIDVRCLVQVGTDVWAGTSRGLFCNGRYVRLKEVENVCALAAVGDSLLYVGQKSGLSCYSIPTGRLHVLHTLIPGEGARASSTVISALLWQPSDSTLWVGTDAGLGTLEQLQKGRLQFDLPIVKCLAFDTEGNILAGTDDGLYVMDHRQRLWHLSHDDSQQCGVDALQRCWRQPLGRHIQRRVNVAAQHLPPHLPPACHHSLARGQPDAVHLSRLRLYAMAGRHTWAYSCRGSGHRPPELPMVQDERQAVAHSPQQHTLHVRRLRPQSVGRY